MADVSIALGSAGGVNILQNDSGAVFDTATNSMGIGGATVAGTSLNLASATQAMRPNRGTTTQRLALTPAESMMFYDTTLHALYVYNGTSWVASNIAYQEQVVAIDFGGIFSVPVSANVTFTRLGNMVTALIPDIFGESDVGSTAMVSAGTVPAPYRAAAATFSTCLAVDNDAEMLGLASLGTPWTMSVELGVLNVTRMAFDDNWSGLSTVGDSGVRSFSFSYVGA